MAEHSNGEHRVFESSTGSTEGSKITASMEMSSKSPSKDFHFSVAS